MKNVWQTIRELWKIPRYHALMVIGLYFLFFAIIFLILSFRKIDTPKEIITKTTFENYQEMLNYEYTYTLKGIKNNVPFEDKIKGIYYHNKNTFEYLHNTYEIKDKNIYLKEEKIENLFDFDIIHLEPIHILSYLEESIDKEIVKNVVKYNDRTIKTEYKIQNLKENTFLTILIYEKNNFIYQIELDVTDLLKRSDIQAYQIIIEYNNINQIVEYQNN